MYKSTLTKLHQNEICDTLPSEPWCTVKGQDSQLLDLICAFTLNQWHEIYKHADFEPKIQTVIRASAFKCKFVL